MIKKDIDLAISVSGNMSYFAKVMRTLGYEFCRGYKYEYIVHPMEPEGVRLINLGEGYTLDSIQRRMRNERQYSGIQFEMQDDLFRIFETPPWEFHNVRELYVNFVTIIEFVKERPRHNIELFRTLWEEELIFDMRVEQQNLMLDNNLRTDEDIEKYKAGKEADLRECEDTRRLCRNALKRAQRAGNEDEIFRWRRDISHLSEMMSRYRNEIKICDRILDDAPELEKQMKYIQERMEMQRRRIRSRRGWER